MQIVVCRFFFFCILVCNVSVHWENIRFFKMVTCLPFPQYTEHTLPWFRLCFFGLHWILLHLIWFDWVYLNVHLCPFRKYALSESVETLCAQVVDAYVDSLRKGPNSVDSKDPFMFILFNIVGTSVFGTKYEYVYQSVHTVEREAIFYSTIRSNPELKEALRKWSLLSFEVFQQL